MYWIVTFFIGITQVTGWNERTKRELEGYLTPQEKNYYFGEGTPDYEIVYPPETIPLTNTDFPYDLSAFGSEINLRLRPNEYMISPDIKFKVRNSEEIKDINETIPNCHYLHTDETTAAALSFCEQNQMHGILFLPNDTLEIQPIPRRLHSAFPGNSIPHIVRRAPYIPYLFMDDDLLLRSQPPDIFQRDKRENKAAGKKRLTIETALFFDEAGYRIFAPYFEYKDEKMRDMLLAYINGVQALYHHPSLGQPFDIVLVRLEIFKKQPTDLPHYNGERNQLLDSFCAYNEKHNPKGDNNPQHWDMGLYVSGLDFFAYENGRKSSVTMGLATVGGVCIEKYNCIIAELGTTNVFGKPYPSAGFTSVYILAHEMGHNIGMHHDSTGNNCPKEGYIMSPSRGTNGETLWSSCSAGVVSSMPWAKCLEDSPPPTAKHLDHSKYEDLPGQVWGAKKQCEVLLRDKDAVLYNQEKLQGICENLQCRTPHRSGFYFAGPALEGTNCGVNKWCQGGACVFKQKKKPEKVVKGGWSDWVPIAECSSGCIEKARGYQPRRRTCTNPRPLNTDEGCEGPGYDVMLCKDEKLCKKKRRSVTEYATMKCEQFSKLLPDLDKNAAGLQAPHEDVRLWMGCAIFCRRKDGKSFYTPRLDLNDLGVDPYFPDGTWCHYDGKMNHYCLQHHCLPENFKFVKGVLTSEDVPLPQNAPPEIKPPPDEILQYLSIDSNRRPLLTTLKPGQTKPPSEDEWIDKDYLEMPDFRQQPTYYAMK